MDSLKKLLVTNNHSFAGTVHTVNVYNGQSQRFHKKRNNNKRPDSVIYFTLDELRDSPWATPATIARHLRRVPIPQP